MLPAKEEREEKAATHLPEVENSTVVAAIIVVKVVKAFVFVIMPTSVRSCAKKSKLSSSPGFLLT